MTVGERCNVQLFFKVGKMKDSTKLTFRTDIIRTTRQVCRSDSLEGGGCKEDLTPKELLVGSNHDLKVMAPDLYH